jgi:TonB family protein
LPLRIYDLHSALGFGSTTVGAMGASSGSLVRLPFGWKDTGKKIRQHDEHGNVRTCVEYENDLKRSLEICVDESSGVLYRDPVSYQEKDVQAVNNEKVYPRSLGFIEDGKVVAKVSITELVTPEHFPANSFDLPAGISARPGCMNPLSPRLVKKVSPEYPQTALHRRNQGLVAVDAIIGLDGVPRVGKVASHADSDLERASLDAIKGWRFEPAMCEGKQVEIETVLEVKFSIQ